MSAAQPKATIVINNYNYARFLPDAIDSALAQTYPDVEVIVVDDGSSDASLEVIAGYGDAVVPVAKDNGGQGSAYNAGFAQSSGDIVCFLDADDVLDHSAIALAVEAMREEGVVKAQWPMLIADATGRSDGRTTTVEPPPDGSLLDRVVREGPLYDFNYHTNCVFGRAFLSEVMPVPEVPYRISADEYLVTLAPVYGSVVTLPKPLGAYRVHGANNYAGRLLDDDRVRADIERYRMNATLLAEHLTRAGLDVDATDWYESAFNYLWPTRLLEVRRRIIDVVPEGEPYVLIDGGEWGGSTTIGERRASRLIECDNVYWGDPATDDEAVDALRERYRAGARAVVVWWTCDWWLDAYPALFRFLREVSFRVEQSSAATIFRLSDIEVEVE